VLMEQLILSVRLHTEMTNVTVMVSTAVNLNATNIQLLLDTVVVLTVTVGRLIVVVNMSMTSMNANPSVKTLLPVHMSPGLIEKKLVLCTVLPNMSA